MTEEIENKKKKVLLVITKSNWGGAQRYVYDLATNLNKDIFEVAVAMGSQGSVLEEKLETAGIRTIIIDRLGRDVKITDDFKVLTALIKLFKSEQPDVVHLNSSKIGAMGALAGRFTRIPKIIFTAHAWAFNEDRGSLSKMVIKVIHWLTLIFSHEVIAVSNNLKDRVSKWAFVSADKLKVIHLGLGKMELLSRKESREVLFGDKFKLKAILIGTIAELHSTKGHRYMIEALSDIRDFDFIYVMIGEGEERENLIRLIEERGLKEKVFLFGHIDEAPKYLKAFDIFTLNSVSEGLSYSVLEAGAASLPIVASRTGGVPEIVDNLENGLLVTPRRPNEIKNALIYLNNHPEDMAAFGKKIHAKVTEKFSLERMIWETEEIYRS